MKIPVIKPGIAASVSVNLNGPQRNVNWHIERLTKMQLDNPILAEFLLAAAKQFGESASLVGLVAVRMIESQMEADELEELFA